MNGTMNENQLTIVKEYEFDNPLIDKIDFIIDGCYRERHNKSFHTFKYVCIQDIKLTNITNNEISNIKISEESLGLYELNEKLTVARQRAFKFIQISKFKIKVYSNLSHINVYYYLKLQTPMGHRLFSRRIAQNREYIQTYCNERRNPFHLACRQCYSYNYPQCNML